MENNVGIKNDQFYSLKMNQRNSTDQSNFTDSFLESRIDHF